MAATQAQVDKLVTKYALQVAEFLGMPPSTFKVVVGPMPNGSTSGTYTDFTNKTIYIGPDDPELKADVIFELSNATLNFATNPNNQHPYSTDGHANSDSTPSIGAGMAAARYILGDDGVPTYWKTAHSNAFLAADPGARATAANSIQAGTFRMADLHVPAGTTTNNTPSETGNANPLPDNGTGGATGDPTGDDDGDGIPNWIEDIINKTQPDATGPTPAQRRAMFSTYLMGLGIGTDAAMTNLIEHAVQKKWSTAQFNAQLYQTPEFQKEYAGIFNPDGSLKMTPAAYQGQVRQMESYAQQFGVNVKPGQIQNAIQNNQSVREFGIRVQADSMLRDNKQLFDAYNAELKREGLAPLDKQGMLKYIMGLGDKEYYQVWQRAETRNAANTSGITVGNAGERPYSVGYGTIKKVAGLGLSAEAQAAGFAKLANDFRTAMPQSRIQKFGLTKQDLVELEFGGKRQAFIADKVTQILNNQQARETGQGAATLRGGNVGGRGAGTTEGF